MGPRKLSHIQQADTLALTQRAFGSGRRDARPQRCIPLSKHYRHRPYCSLVFILDNRTRRAMTSRLAAPPPPPPPANRCCIPRTGAMFELPSPVWKSGGRCKRPFPSTKRCTLFFVSYSVSTASGSLSDFIRFHLSFFFHCIQDSFC